MNKKAIIALSLLLSACVTEPDFRPEPYLKTEELLQQGIAAYKNDNFTEAAQNFSRALELYKSFDNRRGIVLSLLNLAETAMSASEFAAAELHLKQLKQHFINDDWDADLKQKERLLEVKLQFEQQKYQAALVTLQSVLTELDGQKTDQEKLNLLAMQARLEVLAFPLAQSDGLSKFEAALAKFDPQPLHYQILLKRILAVVALNRKDYQAASSLLKQALVYYQEQASRRATASCLEELATVEIAQHHNKAAREYLQRALLIWQWLKNDYKSNKIKSQLTKIQS